MPESGQQTTGREAATAYFAQDTEWAIEWRRLSARTKADHVEQLLARSGLAPATVLEVGCGDGALLAELARRGLGRRHTGVEVSEPARQLALGQPGITDVLTYDGNHLPFEDHSHELVICSHVLEHAEDPAALTRELIRVSGGLLLIEVPLEDNLSARRPAARALSNRAGHLHHFTKGSLRALLPAEIQILGELVDPLPRQASTFWAGRWRGTVKWGIRRLLHATGLSERLITVHYALLARV